MSTPSYWVKSLITVGGFGWNLYNLSENLGQIGGWLWLLDRQDVQFNIKI